MDFFPWDKDAGVSNGQRSGSSWFPQASDEAAASANVVGEALRLQAPANNEVQEISDEGEAATGIRLLVLAHQKDNDTPSTLARSLEAGGYQTDSIEPVSHEQVAWALRGRSIRIVILEIELLDSVQLKNLLDVRRRYPAVDWVLAWNFRSDRWVDLVVEFQARGCIERSESHDAKRAIDAILLGNLWFPQWLIDALYAKLLSALREGRIDSTESPSLSLTPREAQSLELMRRGLTNKQIALRLQISVNTVKKHLKNAFDKRGMHSRRQGLL